MSDERPVAPIPLPPSQKRRNWLNRFVEKISRHIGVEVHIPVIGISVRPKTVLGWILTAFLLASAIYGIFYFRHIQAKALKVAVFYPDPDTIGAAYKDGSVQEDGFQSAIGENPPAQPPKFVKYKFPKQNGGVPFDADLIPKMKALYAEGYHIFVLTMSAANSGIKAAFKDWYAQYKGSDDSPILIATVASAPGIADVESGIFRFYVRSEEEASELAHYAAWKYGLGKIGVFYVNDAYGNGGLKTFDHAFVTDLRGNIEPYDVQPSGVDAALKVRAFIDHTKNEKVGAFVVGYDAMLKKTLEELVNQGFSGPVLCSSTLTAPDWQPDAETKGHEIVTVIPHRDGPHSQMEDNVVFELAKITLTKVLREAGKSHTTREFALNWQQDKDNDGVEAFHLVDGDAIIPMQVTPNWRAERQR